MALAPFLEHLFATGEAKFTEPPEADDPREVQTVLRQVFAEYRLDVAGPPIDFDPDAASAAAIFTARACWFVVSRDEPPEVVEVALEPLDIPKSAAGHLSFDLTLRYVATVYRRAHAQNPEDVLATRLAETLRHCPLSGVLADIADAPAGDLTFAGHRGLELLYAERLADHFRPAWLPSEGQAREVIEWVWQQQGKKLPAASGPA
jgi:MoxR-vWA-beta-propeller ternary system domain bpX4